LRQLKEANFERHRKAVISSVVLVQIFSAGDFIGADQQHTVAQRG
jgi:hypothetical protein